MQAAVSSVDGAVRGKFRRDLAWNFGALAVSGIGGLALNALIGVVYGPAALGIFNQVFAGYIFLSQLAVFGIHFSALKHLSESVETGRKTGVIIGAAFVAVLPIAAAVAGLFALAAPAYGGWLASPDVTIGVYAAAPGLMLFALNKVVLSVFNGFRQMRLYAVFQALRFVVMLGSFALGAALGLSRAYLPFVLSAAEASVFLLSFPLVVGRFVRTAWTELWPHVRAHLWFGARSLLSGVLIELNSRIDIIVLGYVFDDAAVGLYSFAAVLAEGFLQLLVVVRANFNPILARLVAEKRFGELTSLVGRSSRRTYLAAAAVGGVAILSYPLLVGYLGSGNYSDSWSLFTIIMIGVVVSSGYMPFSFLLLQAGFPGWHSFTVALTVACNLLGNVVLIGPLGLAGAAVATGASFVISVLLVRIVSRRLLPIAI